MEGAGGEVVPAPLVARLVTAAIARAEPELAGDARIYRAPAGLGGALIGGLSGIASSLRGGGLTSALGAALAPGAARELDADVVVVYVLGGVTPSEIREVREAVKAAEAQHARAGGTSGSDKPPPRIVVGGTRLIMPHALIAQLWQA